MTINNGFKIGTTFEGHTLALSVLGLLRYGRLINWDDDTSLDRVHNALVETGDMYLIAMLNQSDGFRQGAAQLEALGTDKGKEQFLMVTTATVGAVLQEWGGMIGIEHRAEVARKATANHVMSELHGQDLSGNKTGDTDSFTTRRFGGEAMSTDAVREAVAKQAGVSPDRIMPISLNAAEDIEAQLASMDVPESVKSALRTISEAVKKEAEKLDTHKDANTAETLRKQGKLN